MKTILASIYVVSALFFLSAAPGMSQENNLRIASSSGDQVDCGVYLSSYREFLKIEYFDFARDPWIKAFDNCPDSGLRLYVDGVKLYRKYIEEASDDLVREVLIDTLMLIYDRRMEYFGDEGNVLGRKGRDLLTYGSADIDKVRKAYEMLYESIEIEGTQSRETTMLLYLKAGLVLNQNNKIDDVQLVDDYILLSGILGQLEQRSSRWKKTRGTIDDIVLKEGILNCDALDRYYAIHFEESKQDRTFLETTVSLYQVSGCIRSDYHLAASEILHGIVPDPESAHNLGILYISLNNNAKAAEYLKEAVKGQNLDSETKAQWLYELALVKIALENHCDAIAYARESVTLKEDFGKAYMVLGDAFVASRNSLGDDFQKRTAFWAASDQYRKAVKATPSLESEIAQKLNYVVGQYPDSEEIFFRDLKNGEAYLVEGCINESTTVKGG
jgi:tetratricopeptide (TPR) repeat protein